MNLTKKLRMDVYKAPHWWTRFCLIFIRAEYSVDVDTDLQRCTIIKTKYLHGVTYVMQLNQISAQCYFGLDKAKE